MNFWTKLTYSARLKILPGVYAYIKQVLAPSTYQRRISEIFDVQRETTKKTVNIDIRAPELSPYSIYVPIINSSKGSLYDGLRIIESPDGDGVTLNYRDGLVVTIAAYKFLFEQALKLHQDETRWPSKVREVFIYGVELIVLSNSKTWMPSGRRRPSRAHRLKFDFAAKIRDAHPTVTEDDMASVLGFLNGHIDDYHIIAQVAPRSRQFKLCYQYEYNTRGLIDEDLSGRHSFSWAAKVQRLARPLSGNILLPLQRATEAASYHLELSVPPGSFVERVRLVDRDKRQIPSMVPALHNSHWWYYRRPRTGRTSVHFYSRDLARLKVTPYLRVSVYERPWGSLAIGAASTVIVLPLVYLFGAASRIDQGEKTLPIDVVAAGVALPSFSLALFTSLIFVSRRALLASFSARAFCASGVAVLATSIAGYILEIYLIATSKGKPVSFVKFWRVLENVSLMIALFAVTLTLIRVARYVIARRKFS